MELDSHFSWEWVLCYINFTSIKERWVDRSLNDRRLHIRARLWASPTQPETFTLEKAQTFPWTDTSGSLAVMQGWCGTVWLTSPHSMARCCLSLIDSDTMRSLLLFKARMWVALPELQAQRPSPSLTQLFRKHTGSSPRGPSSCRSGLNSNSPEVMENELTSQHCLFCL